MADHPRYPVPKGLYVVPDEMMDLRPDSEVHQDLMNPKPIVNEKNIFFFWHSGFENMHPYTKRNIRAWYRRFSKQGWITRVINRQPGSPLNVANFLDIQDPDKFPKAFRDGTVGGTYGIQHTSDLVRWPLLLKYGGVYADVGMIQIGDLDRLWNETVGDPKSGFEILSYNIGETEGRNLTNYFLCSGKNNPLFLRSHKLLLKLWDADGGKTCTDGMHASPLLKGAPFQVGATNMSMEQDGKVLGHEEVQKILSDYIVQGHVMTQVMGLIDEEDNWNGPQYVADHVYAIEYMQGSQLINDHTAWNGHRAFELMSLPLPKDGEVETEDQKKAREIVEGCLQISFGFKLAHGLIVKVLGDTLGSLWRKHDGSDNVPGTYAHWLRHGTIYWNQEHLPSRLEFKVIEPYKRGPLLREI